MKVQLFHNNAAENIGLMILGTNIVPHYLNIYESINETATNKSDKFDLYSNNHIIQYQLKRL